MTLPPLAGDEEREPYREYDERVLPETLQLEEDRLDGFVKDGAERDGAAGPQRRADRVVRQEAAQAGAGLTRQGRRNGGKPWNVLGQDQRGRSPATVESPRPSDARIRRQRDPAHELEQRGSETPPARVPQQVGRDQIGRASCGK